MSDDLIARLRGEPTWSGLVETAKQSADKIAELEAMIAALKESGATLYAELYGTRERVFQAAALLDMRLWEPVGIISREWAQQVSKFLDEVGYND